MKTADVIAHFGNSGQKVAKALKISPSAVSQWGEYPPELRQYQLEKMTHGKLKAATRTDLPKTA